MDFNKQIESNEFNKIMVLNEIENNHNLAFYLDSINEDINREKEYFVPTVLTKDTPFFTPDEMIKLGVYGLNSRYSNNPDNTMLSENISTSDWFKKYYTNIFSGIRVESYESMWIDKLRFLYSDYNSILESNNIDKINSRKQSILELGWNPEILFNLENRLLATERIQSILRERYEPIIDLQESIMRLQNISITEGKKYNDLVPVYIVLIGGKSLFSSIIKKIDNGIYSHATIGFDSSLERLYSYNVHSPEGDSGFSIENIKNCSPTSNIAVYAIFVKPKDLERMKNRINYYIENKAKTKYSYKGLLGITTGFPFEHSDLNMICSQFVDSILKFAGIDITYKASFITSPNDYARSIEFNNRIYLLYKGLAKDYNKTNIDKFIKSIRSEIKYVKEGLVNDNIIVVKEVKSIPIEFDDDGNLLIENMKKIDYESEYQKSHKLLLAYEKSNNIPGMKYEISKLWFLNTLIEDLKDYKKYTDIRARILNDFYKYLKIICNKEEDFNFADYYNSTPFSDSTIRISQNTLRHGMKLLSKILL